MHRKLFSWLIIMDLFALTLTACGATSATNPLRLSTAVPSPAASDCLIGNWQISDFTSYFNSIGSKISSTTNSNVTVVNKGATGTVWFKFNSDGTAEVSSDTFIQNFELTSGVLDIGASVTINGSEQAKYAVSADQIMFTDQQAGDIKIIVTVMGNTTDVSNIFLGQAGTPEQYLFNCIDANTLSLKVVTSKLDFAPIILTRAQ